MVKYVFFKIYKIFKYKKYIFAIKLFCYFKLSLLQIREQEICYRRERRGALHRGENTAMERVRKFAGTSARLAHRRRNIVEELCPEEYARGEAGAAREISSESETNATTFPLRIFLQNFSSFTFRFLLHAPFNERD